jgi:magnesium transporter
VSPDRSAWFPLPRRGGKSRQETLVPRPGGPDGAPGAANVDAAIVDCALYEHGARRRGRVALETALDDAAMCPGAFVWIGLHDPSPETVETIGRHFDLHPLAVEDAVHAHQRAKLEVFGHTLFLVMKTAQYIDSVELVTVGELMVFLGERFVVTVRHGEASPLHEVREDLEAHPDLLGIGPSAVLYAVADRVVDDYGPVIESFSADVDQIEAEVFSGTNPTERIYRLKREVLEFRRAVTPLLSPMQRLADQRGLPLDPRTSEYFRDVADHVLRDTERIGAFDELLTGVLHANLAQLTNRDNRDMRRISAWVAILAVPTMVFGLYGMNFEHMPELRWEFGYPLVIVVTLAICTYLYWRFKRSGWM